MPIKVKRFSGDRLRQAREQMPRPGGRKVNQDDFAAMCQFSRRSLQRYEGGSNPKADHLAVICAVTGRDADWFFTDSPDDDDEEPDPLARSLAVVLGAVLPHLPDDFVGALLQRAREKRGATA